VVRVSRDFLSEAPLPPRPVGVIGQADFEEMAVRAREAGLACPPEEDKARQDLFPQTDVNRVVNVYGENFHAMSRPVGVDYRLDLQTAIAAVQQSVDEWQRLPEPIRREFVSWDRLVDAAHDGSLESFLEKLRPASKKAAEPSAAGAEGSGA